MTTRPALFSLTYWAAIAAAPPPAIRLQPPLTWSRQAVRLLMTTPARFFAFAHLAGRRYRFPARHHALPKPAGTERLSYRHSHLVENDNPWGWMYYTTQLGAKT